jgi:NET1-associated nuclear protein 1 (U3 small nucleolar RNA-associated protein 17)
MSASSSEWDLNVVTGGKIAWLPHSSFSSSIFTADERYVIVLLQFQIRVYFISTRQCIRTIDIDLSSVVDVRLHGSNPHVLMLCTSFGEFITVNWKDKMNNPIVSKYEVDTPYPILSVICTIGDDFVVIAGKRSKNSLPVQRVIYRVSPESSVVELAQIDNVIDHSVSLNGTKFVAITSDHEALVYDFQSLDEEVAEIPCESIKFPFKSAITSVAVSNSSVVALGTSAGTIQVLYGGLTSEKPQKLLKWHIDQVRSLQFTPDSAYLLSGGLEKVLVFWHLETDKNQFLPRLNGSIERISLDNNKNNHYSLLLKHAPEDDNNELLILSSVDLVSRLSVNTIRPKLANNVNSTITKAKKKWSKSESFDKANIRHDYSSIFEIHPKTKNLYIPNNAIIQAYDLVKNEQAFVQNAAPVLSSGKVRSESKLIDPTITHIAFTHDGEWLCTFDCIVTSEVDNLLSKNDKQYALKFWKFVESNTSKSETNSINNKTGHWELSTKIIDPHGNSNAIFSIIPAPVSYYNGVAFLTADGKGGLRIWRPRTSKEAGDVSKNTKVAQTAWTLRKSKPSGALFSDAVDICWSPDGSIIILGHECSISLVDTHSFEQISNDLFKIPSISGSRIRSLSIVDNNLIVLSKTRLSSFNLLTGKLNELVANINTTVGGKNLLCVDPIKNLICVAVNYYEVEPEFTIKSKILIFKPDQLKPVYVHHYDFGISTIRYFVSSFIFIDINSRVGVIQPSSTAGNLIEDSGLVEDMNSMLIKAQATANVINHRNISTNSKATNSNQTIDESLQTNKVIDLNTILPIFDNVEGIQIETLFDRIIKVIK